VHRVYGEGCRASNQYERLRLGWNQTALAYHARMSVGDISRIESGRLRPYPSQLEKLGAALTVQADALLKRCSAEKAERS